ncbi:hypothetical protein OROHE_024465 [Orobanche hederae]
MIERFLDDLFTKRANVREAALSSIIDDLKINYRSQFASKNFATLLYRCLNCFKKGSPKEIVLASRALDLMITPSPPPPHIMYCCTVPSSYVRLLSITVGCGDNAQELYKESLPLLSHALKSRTELLLLSVCMILGNDICKSNSHIPVIDSLAIATFVGASDCKETEASMHIIWHFIHSNSGDNVVVQKHSAFLLSAAISAWSLLLTTVDGWNINHSYWHG